MIYADSVDPEVGDVESLAMKPALWVLSSAAVSLPHAETETGRCRERAPGPLHLRLAHGPLSVLP